MYKMYSTGTRTEHCGNPAAKFLGEESSLSTENLNFLLVKKEAISLTRLVENSNSGSLYSRPGGPCFVKRLFDVQEYSSLRHIVTEIQRDVIC
jgi:hypothetical protein